MRFLGSPYGVELLERLLLVLLNGQGMNVEYKDGSKPFERFGQEQSEAYTRRIKVGSFWFRFFYDKRVGDDRWGIGELTVNHKELKELIERLEAKQGKEIIDNGIQSTSRTQRV